MSSAGENEISFVGHQLGTAPNQAWLTGAPPCAAVRIREQHRRVERRQVRIDVVVVALERRPGRVDDERQEHDEGDRRTAAPVVGSRGLAEPFRVPTDHGQVCGHVAADYREMAFALQDRSPQWLRVKVI